MAGGALLCQYLLDMPFQQFLGRANEAIASTTFWAGLIKAPVFAVLIGLISTLSRPAGAQFLARAGAADHRGRGAVHLPGAAGRCAVRGALHEDRFLMAAPTDIAVDVRGVVNRFGRQAGA